MLKWALTMGMSCVLTLQLAAQLKKFYSLNEVSHFDTVNFNFVATSGHSYWRLVPQDNPLLIYGNPDLEKINPSFDAIVTGRRCDVKLRLEEFRSSGLGDGLAFAMLGNSPSEHDDNYWKVLLNNDKVYNLDLHFGIGTSDIDLSGAKVQCLKVKTGSADVKLNYDGENANLCQMDSLNVEVDMGSFTAQALDHARAKYISCKIGFGAASLNFANPALTDCEVKANVGLGSLEVVLPREEPVIIYLNDSPFRGVNMTKDFEEVEKNVFINRAYSAEAKNLLTFKVDVSLGSIEFQYAD